PITNQHSLQSRRSRARQRSRARAWGWRECRALVKESAGEFVHRLRAAASSPRVNMYRVEARNHRRGIEVEGDPKEVCNCAGVRGDVVHGETARSATTERIDGTAQTDTEFSRWGKDNAVTISRAGHYTRFCRCCSRRW